MEKIGSLTALATELEFNLALKNMNSKGYIQNRGKWLNKLDKHKKKSLYNPQMKKKADRSQLNRHGA